MDEIRNILHEFGLTYRVESKENRQQDLDVALAQIREKIVELLPEPLQPPGMNADYRNGFNAAVDEITKRLGEKE